MTSKEALETVKDYLLPKLKEDNSELGSIIIVESVNVLEKLVERSKKVEKLLELYRKFYRILTKDSLTVVDMKKAMQLEQQIKELEDE